MSFLLDCDDEDDEEEQSEEANESNEDNVSGENEESESSGEEESAEEKVVDNSNESDDDDSLQGGSGSRTHVAYDGATRAQLQKRLKLATASSNTGELSAVFRHNGRSYILGITPLLDKGWMIKDAFWKVSVDELLRLKFPSVNKTSEWTKTIKEIFVRRVEHGDNRYKRDSNKRFKHIIWITCVDTAQEDKLRARAINRGRCMYGTMKAMAEDNMLGALVDMYKQDSMEGPKDKWNGLYGYFVTRGNNRGEAGAVEWVTSEMKRQFVAEDIQFHHNPFTFDKYLTDYDIKCIAQKYYQATSWNEVPVESRRVFYRSRWELGDIPDWDTIVEESR